MTPIPRAVALATALFMPCASLSAETLHSSNVDSRLYVGFSVNADAVQTWMPEGWTSKAFPGGPLAGANVLLLMIDQHMVMNDAGAPLDPQTSRTIALAGLAEQEGAARLYVLRLYTDREGSNAYGNSLPAVIDVTAASSGGAGAPRASEQVWSVSAAGGALTLRLAHTVGARGWGAQEALPHSSVNPDFYRIYRFTQLSDVVMSEGLNAPLTGAFSFETSIAELAPMFDGTERLVGVIDAPIYIREIYLP